MDPEKDRSALVRADESNPDEVQLWNAVCDAAGGVIFTSHAERIDAVIEKISDVAWRGKMRPEFLAGILAVAVSDLEDVTFAGEGCQAADLSEQIEGYDAFDINLNLDQMKAKQARRLATALKQHLQEK